MICPECNGTGMIKFPSWLKINPYEDYSDFTCETCEGTGFVEGRKKEEEDGPMTKWLMKLILIAGLILLILLFIY